MATTHTVKTTGKAVAIIPADFAGLQQATERRDMAARELLAANRAYNQAVEANLRAMLSAATSDFE